MHAFTQTTPITLHRHNIYTQTYTCTVSAHPILAYKHTHTLTFHRVHKVSVIRVCVCARVCKQIAGFQPYGCMKATNTENVLTLNQRHSN